MTAPLHIAGHTVHTRRGAVQHRFGYDVDYVLIDPGAHNAPRLFSRNRFNIFSVCDAHYGSKNGGKHGADWARDVFANAGLPSGYSLRLMTQPRILGRAFNPVSFWLAQNGDALIAVIAEVNNTFGDRHSYLCHLPNFAPIGPRDILRAQKVMHVSPFQDIKGDYHFKFALNAQEMDFVIIQRNGDEGVTATLTGPIAPLTNRRILARLARYPFGSIRTIALIYWQALRLKLKGAPYRVRPEAPKQEVSTCSLQPKD